MKDRMLELGIKMTELSQYMKISRPSLYKYLGLFESRDYDQIPEKVLRSFRELNRRKKITKEQFIAFVISEFQESEDYDNKERVRTYLSKCNITDPKLELITQIVEMTRYEEMVPYLSNCFRILSEGPKDDSEIYQVVRFMQMRDQVTKNIPISQEEFAIVKTKLEE